MVACGSLHSYLCDGETITRYTLQGTEGGEPTKEVLKRLEGTPRQGTPSEDIPSPVVISMDCSAVGNSFAYVYMEPHTQKRGQSTIVEWLLDGRPVTVPAGSFAVGSLNGAARVSLSNDGKSLVVFNPHPTEGWCKVFVPSEENPAIAELDEFYQSEILGKYFLLALDDKRNHCATASDTDSISTFVFNTETERYRKSAYGVDKARGVGLAISEPYTASIFKHVVSSDPQISVYDFMEKRVKTTIHVPWARNLTNFALQSRRVKSTESGREVPEFAFHFVPEGDIPVAMIATWDPKVAYQLGVTPSCVSVSKDAKLAMKFESLEEDEEMPGSRAGRVTFYEYAPVWVRPLERETRTPEAYPALTLLPKGFLFRDD